MGKIRLKSAAARFYFILGGGAIREGSGLIRNPSGSPIMKFGGGGGGDMVG